MKQVAMTWAARMWLGFIGLAVLVPVVRVLYAGLWVMWHGFSRLTPWGAWGCWCLVGSIVWILVIFTVPVVAFGLTIKHFDWLVKTAAWKPRSRPKGPRRF